MADPDWAMITANLEVALKEALQDADKSQIWQRLNPNGFEGVPIDTLSEGASEVLGVDKSVLDLEPALRRAFRQAREVNREGPENGIGADDRCIVFKHLQALITVAQLLLSVPDVIALLPPDMVVEQQPSAAGEVPGPVEPTPETQGPEVVASEPPAAANPRPPTKVTQQMLSAAVPAMKEAGYFEDDPDLHDLWALFEAEDEADAELLAAMEAIKTPRSDAAKEEPIPVVEEPAAGETGEIPVGPEGSPTEEPLQAPEPEVIEPCVNLASISAWAARNELPQVKMAAKKVVKAGNKAPTFREAARAVRVPRDALWLAAPPETALLECMQADVPDRDLVMKLSRSTKVNVNSKDKVFGLTALHFAATYGDLEIVELIIQMKSHMETCNAKNTALHLAAREGNDNVVKFLLSKKASVNRANDIGWTPLTWSASFGHQEVVQTLLAAEAHLEVKDSDLRTEAMWAARHGHSEVLDIFLRVGFDMDLRDRHGLSVADHARDHLATRHMFLEAGKRNSWLLRAAQRNCTEEVKKALDASANVNARDETGWTALTWSFMHQSVDLVKLLAHYAADPNVLTECSEVMDHLNLKGEEIRTELETALEGAMGGTVRLLAAARQGDWKAVEVELDDGARINDHEKGTHLCALTFAAIYANHEAVIMLGERQAAMDVVDLTGWTALHYAVQADCLESVSALLSFKADPCVATYGGILAQHIAVRCDSPAMIQLLLVSKASINHSNDVGRTPLQVAVKWGSTCALETLLACFGDTKVKDSFGLNLLSIAAANGRSSAIVTLLSSLQPPVVVISGKEVERLFGENVNWGNDPEFDECKTTSEKALKPLKKACFSCNRLRKKMNAHFDKTGELDPSPAGHLLEDGDSEGRRPLHHAVINKHMETAGTLLGFKAEVDAPDTERITPLMLACQLGFVDFIELLLDAGAKLEMEDAHGRSASDHATLPIAKNYLQQVVLKQTLHAMKLKRDELEAQKRAQKSRQAKAKVEAALTEPTFLYKVRLENISPLMLQEEVLAEVRQLLVSLPIGAPAFVHVPVDPFTQMPKGYAYADFSERHNATELVDLSRKTATVQIQGRNLRVVNEGVRQVPLTATI